MPNLKFQEVLRTLLCLVHVNSTIGSPGTLHGNVSLFRVPLVPVDGLLGSLALHWCSERTNKRGPLVPRRREEIGPLL